MEDQNIIQEETHKSVGDWRLLVGIVLLFMVWIIK